MKVIEKLAALRSSMREQGLSAYIVPGADPHASEYMAAHWMEMSWLSGFKGETGTVVVTMDKALLWTDSRYYLQADIELKDSTIGLMRESDIDCPTIAEWLVAQGGALVGLNPEMYSVNAFRALKEQLGEAGIGVQSVDLIKPLWAEGRPAIPQAPFYEFEVGYAGEDVASKLARVREAMRQKNANAMVISALDEIAWLLNIRGKDVEYNPLVISYVVLEQDRCTLFVAPEKVPSVAHSQWGEQVAIQGYEEVFGYIRQLQGTVLYDGARVNEALFEAIPEACRKVNAQSPIMVMKAKKNAVELEGEHIAMREDAVALTRFFRWLEDEAFANGQTQTECTIADKLHDFRAMGKHFTDESFGTIAGYKGNGAIVHYSAEPATCATVRPEGMLLLDSGGQYLDGTTDITRTVWLGGEIPAQAKRDYTYVLKGHIALQQVRFPRGTRGNQLDALAKQYMWAAGITYGHGTGHGVGHFLGCHEGPQNVRTDNNPTALEVGHVISDEPGIYRTGEWGIRTENLITVVPAPATEAATTNDQFLTFETLTLCFYDTQLIDFSLMTADEIAWLNAYHARVYAEIAPLLSAEDAAFLAGKCKALNVKL
ncbi:MAG: aminopeptidase P family protein [Bacteroidales bacterium]|nr:aminopeptidase P family protein [Bacteroidales bacterium]